MKDNNATYGAGSKVEVFARQGATVARAIHHSRDKVVDAARAWIGTPYHHQASLCGVGTDCLGLIRGVYRTLYGKEAASVPGYSRDWAEAAREETMLDAAGKHLISIAVSDARPADVVIFRWRAGFVAKHAAILSSDTKMIHAIEGAPVSEVTLSPWWRRHMAGAFSFPGSFA